MVRPGQRDALDPGVRGRTRGREIGSDADDRQHAPTRRDELVTVNELVDIVEQIAGVRLKRRYRLDAPQGVRGRNSDNTLIRQKLGWAPSVPLADGLEKTYRWIHDQMTRAPASSRPGPPARRPGVPA